MSRLSSLFASPLQRRLPVEIWERIIDLFAAELGTSSRSRQLLVPCALTCRAWLPRARHHLYQLVYISCTDGLDGIIQTLSHYPGLCDRVSILQIDGDDSHSSWVIRAFFYLAPRLKHLSALWIAGVDLTQCHPDIFKALSVFNGVHLNDLVLHDVRCSQWSQLARCISAVKPRTAVIQTPDLSKDVDVPRAGQNIPHHIAPFRFRRQNDLRWVRLEVPWAELEGLCRSLFFAAQGPSLIRIDACWSSIDELRATRRAAVKAVIRLIYQFSVHNEDAMSIRLYTGYHVDSVLSRLRRGESPSQIYESAELSSVWQRKRPNHRYRPRSS